MIRTSIKNKLIVHQLNYVVEKTVQVNLVKEIIEYCVPEQILDSLWIMGSVNEKIHAKMAISITYVMVQLSFLLMEMSRIRCSLPVRTMTGSKAKPTRKKLTARSGHRLSTGLQNFAGKKTFL